MKEMTEQVKEGKAIEINEFGYNDFEDAKEDMEILKEKGYNISLKKLDGDEDDWKYMLEIYSNETFTEIYQLLEKIKKEREDESFTNLFNERLIEMLNKDFFIISEKDISKIVKEEFEYPNYDTKELRFLLSKMAFTKELVIMKGKRDEQDWKISWQVRYFTSPKQFKILFRDFLKDYPQLILHYNYTIKESGKGVIGEKKISLGQCVSLLKNYNSFFVV